MVCDDDNDDNDDDDDDDDAVIERPSHAFSRKYGNTTLATQLRPETRPYIGRGPPFDETGAAALGWRLVCRTARWCAHRWEMLQGYQNKAVHHRLVWLLYPLVPLVLEVTTTTLIRCCQWCRALLGRPNRSLCFDQHRCSFASARFVLVLAPLSPPTGFSRGCGI